ncbi:ubiquinone biosynthesis O-methyltransferase, mitochondrial-like isoform X2 [Colias croceus]|uniref:ubiquinone biosynthesis O-methyltransferase, mitochondrial-like isoform X2 n=1 Tax=Colias crocea TaxID=72248 RepID=UPI001E27AEA8|nr:ubiquinone biosynthesis O-methyltransferase, mitochondrial-like isoform X2 [Colias croceus]
MLLSATRMSNPESSLTTVDKGEIERHGKLTGDWWSETGIIQPLHTFNAIRVPYITDCLVIESDKRKSSKPLANKLILDIGCGGGLLSEPLAKLGAKVTGVDACSSLIDLAKEHSDVDPEVAKNKPTYYCESIEEHSQKYANYYDAVIASEIVDHVANVELFLKHCVETLKPGGKIIITTPNKTRLSQFCVVFMAENVLNIIPKGIHKYAKFKSPKDVSEILHKYNCQVNNVHGILYNPVTGNWFWSYFQTIWYALEATKLC